MKREDWPEALADFIESRRNTPFAWGTTDCTLFAADAVEAITGADPAAQYRGKYSDHKGALRLIKEAGGLSGLVPLQSVEPGFASRGDIVMIEIAGSDALGVHLGRSIAAQGVDGLVFLPVDAIEAAWKVS